MPRLRPFPRLADRQSLSQPILGAAEILARVAIGPSDDSRGSSQRSGGSHRVQQFEATFTNDKGAVTFEPHLPAHREIVQSRRNRLMRPHMLCTMGYAPSVPLMPYMLAGFGVGILGGLFGVGGAEMVIPLLVYVFGFAQHAAQGTSLAMLLPPLGLLAALRYYERGYVDFTAAGWLALGFFFGAPLGAYGATALHPEILRKVFGIKLLVIALHMIFAKHGT